MMKETKKSLEKLAKKFIGDVKPKTVCTEQENTGDIVVKPSNKTSKDEEWIWVEGYKGTKKDMTCRGFQYELGVQYDMPEDEEICECYSGFHLCFEFHDVLKYYCIGNGHRFFKVKALVRKDDKDKYGKNTVGVYSYSYAFDRIDKIVAKSIIFISELTRDEILKGRILEEMPDKYKDMAIELSIDKATEAYFIDTLVEDGYSLAFATHIVKNKCSCFDAAHAVGSMSDLSMDMKVLYILQNGGN